MTFFRAIKAEDWRKPLPINLFMLTTFEKVIFREFVNVTDM